MECSRRFVVTCKSVSNQDYDQVRDQIPGPFSGGNLVFHPQSKFVPFQERTRHASPSVHGPSERAEVVVPHEGAEEAQEDSRAVDSDIAGSACCPIA